VFSQSLEGDKSEAEKLLKSMVDAKTLELEGMKIANEGLLNQQDVS